ncbi:MAG: hypothetical protein HQM00_17320, partial [Magnetococcales bacterium]|nr:hypothetical protein [Magnetococcales bacterium]
MNTSTKSFVIPLVLIALSWPESAQSAPGAGFARSAGTTRVVNAVRTNTR